MDSKTIEWLLECDEPWTRYRTRVDLLGQSETDSEVRTARAAMLAHPQVRQLMAEAATWPGPPLKRHNDASHPLHKLSTLTDLGVQARDRGTATILKTVLAHSSPQGAFQTMVNIPAAHTGVEMLLSHWQHQKEAKFYLFGIGTDFRKKYPFIWYDLLHVTDVLSRFPFVHADTRFRAMVKAITSQADTQGRYTAGSMYNVWKGWSFADKKWPSPWLTFLARRVCQRIEP